MPNEVDWRLENILNTYPHLSKHELNIEYDSKFLRNEFKKINFLKYKQHADIISIKNGFNFIKHLTSNPKHHARIKLLGYSLETFNLESVIHEWYAKLFKLNPRLESIFQEMLNATKPTNQTSLVCVQYRIGGGKDIQFTYGNKMNIFWRQIKNKFIKSSLNDYKLFITTDILRPPRYSL